MPVSSGSYLYMFCFYMHVAIYACLYTCECICVCAYATLYSNYYIYVHEHTSMCITVCMHICMCMYVCACTYVHVCVGAWVGVYVCACIPAVNNNWAITTLLLLLDNLTSKINQASTCARRTMFWPPSVVILNDYMWLTKCFLANNKI